MTTINQKVWKLLRSDLAIQKNLNRGVINMRALAKHLIKTHNLHASLDSVISAIRRFEVQEEYKYEEQLQNLFSDATVSTRSNLACITVQTRDSNIFSAINNIKVPCKLVVGTKEVKLMVNSKDIDNVTALFPEHTIKHIQNSLSEISVALTTRASPAKGVAARITNEIALAQINIAELFVCQPEFMIYVRGKDVVKAHESVMKLVNNE